MTTATPADRWIRRTTTGSVLLLAGIAAVVSYRHMHLLALEHGEPSWTAALIPFSVDGMIIASSMSLLLDSRSGTRSGVLPWVLLLIGSAASLAANVAVAEPTAYGRMIAAWPSFALIGAYELLMRQIRHAASTAVVTDPGRSVEQPRKIPERLTAQISKGQPGRHTRPVQSQRSRPSVTDHQGEEPAGDDLLTRALRLNAEHWSRHSRPVSAEVLRTRLRIGAARARELKDHVRAVQTEAAPALAARI